MAYADNVGGLQITTAENMTVLGFSSTMEGVAAQLQTALRALSDGDVLYYIKIIKDYNSNQVQCYVIYEDQ